MSPFGLLVGLIPAVSLPWALLRKLERKALGLTPDQRPFFVPLARVARKEDFYGYFCRTR
jgi:hypothetical protein